MRGGTRLLGGLALCLAAACSPEAFDRGLGEPSEGETGTAGGVGPASGGRASAIPPDAAADLARMRAGSSRYYDFIEALEEGFTPLEGEGGCEHHPELGATGVLYVHRERFEQADPDPAQPELLLFRPLPEGRMELMGVGFAVEAERWHRIRGNHEAPRLAGVFYDPPDPRSITLLRRDAYTLHVWLWKENPDGIFARFNPRLACE